MSMRRGDRTKPAQAFKNKFAFRHNKHSKKTEFIKAIPNVGLCSRCHEIVEWRKKYRKYKPIKDLKKCGGCNEKKIKAAYHVLCKDCSYARNCCPKCMEARAEQEEGDDDAEDAASLEAMLDDVLLKERQRRMIMRAWERGTPLEELAKLVERIKSAGGDLNNLRLGLEDMGDTKAPTRAPRPPHGANDEEDEDDEGEEGEEGEDDEEEDDDISEGDEEGDQDEKDPGHSSSKAQAQAPTASLSSSPSPSVQDEFAAAQARMAALVKGMQKVDLAATATAEEEGQDETGTSPDDIFA